MTQPTPTVNLRLPFRIGGFNTLLDALAYAARGETGFNFHGSRGRLETVLSYRELFERSRELARRLAALGVARGDRVGLLADTSPDFLLAFFACQWAGCIPVPLPLAVNLGGADAHVARLRTMLKAASARLALAPADGVARLERAAQGTLVRAVLTVAELEQQAPAREDPRPFDVGDPCYIQYSSGSTSFPRGVLVTQRALAANAEAIAAHGVRLREGDRCVSWLPLYHDMGLVGCCLTPVFAQVSVDYISTASFARRPLLWLELLSRHAGTISFSPTFGYELAARRARNGNGIDAYDLRSWRVAGIGGEMIRPDVLDAFADTFAPAGFDRRAFLASYGLAEATLAVTFGALEEEVRVDRVARGPLLECEGLAVRVPVESDARLVRSFVRCGRPLPGYRVEIRDAQGRALPERRIGRICIKGPSLMQAYFRDPSATRAVLSEDGWLDTGDLGYLVEGELVVTGRAKDVVIVGGRNIWPQDLEWAVERLEGVRHVAAFSVGGSEGPERVVVAVECRLRDASAREALRREIRSLLLRSAGVECEILLLPPKSLTFTTSGKLSRAAARRRYLRGEFVDLDEDRSLAPRAMAPALAS